MKNVFQNIVKVADTAAKVKLAVGVGSLAVIGLGLYVVHQSQLPARDDSKK